MFEESADYILERLSEPVVLTPDGGEPVPLNALPFDLGEGPVPGGWDSDKFEGRGHYVLFRVKPSDLPEGVDLYCAEIQWGKTFSVRVARDYRPDGRNAMFKLLFSVAGQRRTGRR